MANGNKPDRADGDDNAAEPTTAGDALISADEMASDKEVEVSLDEIAEGGGVGAVVEAVAKSNFRWWTLWVLAGLCVFYGAATLLTASLSQNPETVKVADDLAKLAVPTLLTLLGTSTAWAFKSED